MRTIALLLATLVAASAARAESPTELLASYRAAATSQTPGYRGPSARAGSEFFHARGKDWSCASCHTENPVGQGRHAKTGKDIAPLAPGANPQRFTDAARVEKWFRRNCNDVLGRACTASEKGDVLAYLVSLGK